MNSAKCVAAAVVFWALALCAEDERNLLRNPSFELGDKGPEGWYFNHRRTDGEIAWDKTRAHSGKASARITNRTKAQTGNVVQSVAFDPPLPPGSRVAFSAFAACENAGGDGPMIIFNLYSTSGERQDAAARCRGGTHDFVEVRGEAVAMRPTKRLVFYLCHYSTGTVWWDDARLTVQRVGAVKVLKRPKETSALPALSTEDGLTLIVSDTGGVSCVRLDGQTVSMDTPNTGLWIRPFGQDVVPVVGTLKANDGAVTQDFEDKDRGLRVRATFAVERSVIKCTGAVEDMRGKDRAVDLWFSIPVGGKAWRWGKSIREEIPLGAGPQSLTVTTFSSVSDLQSGKGIALAVPADAPCDYEFTHDKRFGYAVRFRFGLSPDAGERLKSRAPFAFVIYRCDGRWGLRDAARRYYALYPWAFEKRARREGLWMFGRPPKWLPDPQNYAFHEGGPGGWEYDEKHEIYTCPYIIPGQREIKRLDKLPPTKREALEIFRQLKPSEANRRRGLTAQTKAIISNCMLYDAHGLPHIRIRTTPWGGNSITFPLNANPRLFADTEKMTIAKALLKQVAEMHARRPEIDGTYVDSLGAWGQYLNHRHEHFSYAQVPLTYDMKNGKPVIHNRFTLLEFLWGLREYLHKHDKLLFANGVNHNRQFHFFSLDVMGVEGRTYLEQKRVMANQKPFLLLIYNIHDKPARMEYEFNRCAFYGIYPSFANMRVYKTPEMYAPIAKLNNRFVPVLQAITRAGWQPITLARSSQPDVWLERWGPGPDGAVYLTVYNASKKQLAATIVLEASALGLNGRYVLLEDKLSEDKWRTPAHEGTTQLELLMRPEKLRVLHIAEG